jgi:magnesium-transporting ATPase (P-type)
VGNLVVLTKGDRIPANLRVINRVELSVDESLLSGM